MEMFDRDHERLCDAYQRVNVCPLGAGALAGSTLPLDREMVARLLGFVDGQGNPRLCHNSMDAVSDRDFMVELCGVCALIALHLSRLSEDFILWSSSEFDFIRVSDAFTTGSSLMPQKKNLDVAELSRGKSGRVIGNLMALLTLLKGLPMTYNRDLQEDKEPLFDSVRTVGLTLDIWAAMLREVTVKHERCRAAASDPALLATDLVDYLVRKGVAFRQGHHAVGELVALAEKRGVALNGLSLEEFQQVNPLFEEDILESFELEKAMDKKSCIGSGGTEPLRSELALWRERLVAYSIA
jgi:argininosuccinate lyase